MKTGIVFALIAMVFSSVSQNEAHARLGPYSYRRGFFILTHIEESRWVKKVERDRFSVIYEAELGGYCHLALRTQRPVMNPAKNSVEKFSCEVIPGPKYVPGDRASKAGQFRIKISAGEMTRIMESMVRRGRRGVKNYAKRSLDRMNLEGTIKDLELIAHDPYLWIKVSEEGRHQSTLLMQYKFF